jgi:tetratricopeptide (TPR) repeat protein
MLSRERCHDCERLEGQLHELGCDMESGQLISCGCCYNLLAQRGTHIRRRNRKRSDGTVAIVRFLARVDPTFADAWYNLGDLLDEQGRSEAAIECLRTALRVAPDYADAMFNLALLLQRKDQYAEAADYWRRYLASDCQSEWAARARRSLKFCEMQVRLIASA